MKNAYEEWYNHFEYGSGNPTVRSMIAFVRELKREKEKYGRYLTDKEKLQGMKGGESNGQ